MDSNTVRTRHGQPDEIRAMLRAMSDEQLKSEYRNATREGKCFDTVAVWIRFAAERELRRRKLV